MNPQILRQIVCAPAGENEAGGGASDTTGTLAQAKQTITNTARQTAARIKSAAGDTASRAKTEAQRLATETKEDTAKRIGGYSSAFHESAKSFEEQDPNIAWATHRVADRLQGIADYVRTRDFTELKSDVENLARRHPVAFFGGMVVAGLVIGNLLKARRPTVETSDEMTDMADEPNLDYGNASGSSEAPAMPAPESNGI